jgi:hypothetical protein
MSKEDKDLKDLDLEEDLDAEDKDLDPGRFLFRSLLQNIFRILIVDSCHHPP